MHKRAWVGKRREDTSRNPDSCAGQVVGRVHHREHGAAKSAAEAAPL